MLNSILDFNNEIKNQFPRVYHGSGLLSHYPKRVILHFKGGANSHLSSSMKQIDPQEEIGVQQLKTKKKGHAKGQTLQAKDERASNHNKFFCRKILLPSRPDSYHQ